MTAGERAGMYFGSMLLLALCGAAAWGVVGFFGVAAALLHLLALAHIVVANVSKGVFRAMHRNYPREW